MKKIFTTILMAAVAMAGQAKLVLTVETDDEQTLTITKDTTIVTTYYDEDMEQMGIKGTIVCEQDELTAIVINRPHEGIEDEFCCAGQCTPGNGERSQNFPHVKLEGSETTWFTHFTPEEENTSTEITYSFIAGEGESISLIVYYNYLYTALNQVNNNRVVKGIYNILGQKMNVQDKNELPRGVYIIDGKKQIIR